MERCTLCGGKLRSDGKCSECGLDNTKNDKKYHLNTHNDKTTRLHRGRCEDNLNREGSGAKTFSYEKAEKNRKSSGKAGARPGSGSQNTSGKAGAQPGTGSRNASGKAGAQPQTRENRRRREKELKQRRQTGTVKKKSPALRLIRWVLILFVIIEILSSVAKVLPDVLDELRGSGYAPDILDGLWEEEAREVPDGEDYLESKPEEVSWNVSADGYFEKTLPQGIYQIGYDIPEGEYQFFCDYGQAWINWWTPEEEYGGYVALYSLEAQEDYRETMGESCGYFELSEKVLLEGGIVYVETGGDEDGGVRIVGDGLGEDSLRTDRIQGIYEAVALEDGMTAGEDFPAGVYDIGLKLESEDDRGAVYLEIEKENGAGETWYISLEKNRDTFSCCIFEDGDAVLLDDYTDGCMVVLTPSY